MSPLGYFPCQVPEANVPPHRNTAISANGFWWHVEETPLRAKSKVSLLWHIPFLIFFSELSGSLSLDSWRPPSQLFPPLVPSCCAPSLLEGYLEMLCLSHSQFSRHFGSLAQCLGLTPSSPGPQTRREAVAGKSPWPGRLGLDQTSCITVLVSKSYSR